MIQLANTYRKNGYDYQLIERQGDVAIYSQHGDGRIYGYEVFIVQRNEASERFGRSFPESESVPPTSAWGKEAFTCRNIESANEYAAKLQERILEAQGRRNLADNAKIG